MLSYRLGTVNDFHWEFKQVLSYIKPHTEDRVSGFSSPSALKTETWGGSHMKSPRKIVVLTLKRRHGNARIA